MYLQKLSFSSLQDSDLVNMGVKRNVLLFKDPLPGAQTSKLVIDEEHVDSLCTHIGHIHRHVSMRVRRPDMPAYNFRH